MSDFKPPEFKALDFTGERVVPGLVDSNLFNEHMARYRFAARFARNGRVLDAGCGSGYGTAEFAGAASVIAMDISAEAVAYARHKFSRPSVDFLQGACERLPFADESFDLLAAFEVIEHLELWRQMLAEARRVLRPSGVLLVSTPNKAWYAESRADAGPNPFHVHEFEYREFEAALKEVFPHVHLWTQNHAEAIAFASARPSSCGGILDAPGDTSSEQAQFFLAACSQSPIAEAPAFAWLPSAGNILRERQRHIALLESEISQKEAWLAESEEARARLEKELGGELDRGRVLIGDLQQELDAAHAGYQAQISRLEREAAERLEWVRDLEAQIAGGRAEIDRLDKEYRALEKTIEERNEDLLRARAELRSLEDGTWLRLGRKLQLVPGKPE